MHQQKPPPLTEPDHEVYPSAPLRFVAFEARFSPVPFFETETGRLALYDGLREQFPILQSGPPQSGPMGLVIETPQQMRMMDRSRTVSAKVSPAAVSIETSDYQHFNWFIELIEGALVRLSGIAPIPTIQRVGIRYTDEIRVPGVNHPGDWDGYVDSSLLGPLNLVNELVPEENQGEISFRVHDHHLIRFRYGAVEGWSVDPGGPLNVRNEGAGPYFLIDLDSFWTAPTTEFPEFSVDTTVALVKDLHKPLRNLFEASITEKLRDGVFRKVPGENKPEREMS
jgi:uncharacterized protein (TIGR04255 family)